MQREWNSTNAKYLAVSQSFISPTTLNVPMLWKVNKQLYQNDQKRDRKRGRETHKEKSEIHKQRSVRKRERKYRYTKKAKDKERVTEKKDKKKDS